MNPADINPRALNPEESRRVWAAGDPKRADRGLRRIGNAILCHRCDGQGVVLGREYHYPRGKTYGGGHLVPAPVKCEVCGGEGLDPTAKQEGVG